ncbi:MAG: ABC transporter permease [Clostridium beijerinckii]|jgi:ABC-2 type transport system permease protein|nr:ABC transporter permease [Clostridium beijerinckii]MCI1577488.1 ABC transporter permease [Clostridium beijerinckii]MCI1583261.1 ABC transporter permease [Clostridium beijerinckii]MCI1621161.1 ABC transporter permease [Clostridium beijerinckii]
MTRYIQNLLKYKHLIKELVARDIKVKYKNSVLGLVWSVLNPLLTMVVLTIVFSNLFRFDIENYPVYLITGQVMFNFFSEATNIAMVSINNNAQLIKKVYIPKYIFPLSKGLSSFMNLLFSLIAVFCLLIVMKIHINIAIIFSILSLLYILIFAIGIGLILVSLNVFFRDIEHLYGVFLTMWMYLTPIFYPANIIPERFGWLITINPLFYMVQHFRSCILYGTIPSIQLNFICLLNAAVAFVIGLYVFYKSQDKFILHI